MLRPIDIFKTDSDGHLLWRGAAETLTAAKAFISELADSAPGEYLVLDQHTGQRTRVVTGTSAAASATGLTTATA